MTFFSLGLRPFFTLAVLSAILIPMYLVSVIYNGYPFPGELLDVISWHGHELLFGMIPALLAGFLLTASANWTNTRPIKGLPLAALFLLWIATRLVFFLQNSPLLLMIGGPSFLIILIAIMLHKLRNNRNFLLINSLLGLLLASEIAYLYAQLYSAAELSRFGLIGASISLFYFLFVFSGRLIPFFTNSRFASEITLKKPTLEITIFIFTFFTFTLELFGFEESLLAGIPSFIAALLLFYRSWLFYHPKIWQESMVSCLHMAHFWLPLFMALKALEQIRPEYAIGLPAYHALYTGGIGMFGVSIMGRASMGHTGRPIKSSMVMVMIFFFINLGAMLRVFQPLVSQEMTGVMTHTSMGFWTFGFVLFLFKFLPNYLTPKLDEK